MSHDSTQTLRIIGPSPSPPCAAPTQPKGAHMSPAKPLRGVRILSLALNLPGPAALMRLAQMGARCTKVNPPAGDPMQHYTPDGYALLHKGVAHRTLDLKTELGQKTLHKLLFSTDVLLTSFRPSALVKLGLGWRKLHKQYPTLSLIHQHRISLMHP